MQLFSLKVYFECNKGARSLNFQVGASSYMVNFLSFQFVEGLRILVENIHGIQIMDCNSEIGAHVWNKNLKSISQMSAQPVLSYHLIKVPWYLWIYNRQGKFRTGHRIKNIFSQMLYVAKFNLICPYSYNIIYHAILNSLNFIGMASQKVFL